MSIYARDDAGNRFKIAGAGEPGTDGKSAYQYALEGGFIGTEEEFTVLLGRAGCENLLDNWYFVEPVNQRGQVEYMERGYTIDRWRSMGGPAALRIQDSCITVTTQLAQPIENGTSLLIGKTATISILTYEGQLITASGPITTENKSILLARTFDCGNIMLCQGEDGMIYFQINPAAGHEIGLLAAKLELSPVQTLARQDVMGNWVLNAPPPNKVLELIKCERFYYRHTGWCYLLKNGSTDSQTVTIAFPTTMRTAPTVTLVQGIGIEQITTSATSNCLLAYKNGDVSTKLGIFEFTAEADF